MRFNQIDTGEITHRVLKIELLKTDAPVRPMNI